MQTKSFLPNVFAHPYAINEQYAKPVAYFSSEIAIDNTLKTYSGGLGFLAGSHMRSAFDLKQNMVGISILWTYGYYNQVRAENRDMAVQFRKKIYSFLEDHNIKFLIRVYGAPVWVKAYFLNPNTFGTAPIFFLTTDIEENDETSRTISRRLYDDNKFTRIAQYILLGVGGARLLEEIGAEPEIYHLNEAHAIPAAFHLLSKNNSLEQTRKRLVFTTHTPEEAGNERFDCNLLENFSFFSGVATEQVRQIAEVGADNSFNLSLAALRMSKVANGVSKLHGEVSNDMWKKYSGICPITSITNAQNKKFWCDHELEEARLSGDVQAFQQRKKELKKELFTLVGDQTGSIFDPNVLTMVWARRFASYKRPDLLVQDMAAFDRLMKRSNRPIQIIWAGKPYPSDHNSVDIFNKLRQLTEKYPRTAVLVGYELALSRELKCGADVWLNNPIIPREASGTSGMSAAMNGAVNLSTFDGWVREFAKDKQNCFLVPPADASLSPSARDRHDLTHLYRIIEEKVLPTYYDKPKDWVQIAFNGMQDVAPMFDSDRMAGEYYSKIYNY